MKECNAVFEGGGVKGIGFAGAICAFFEAGYVFKKVAGSSAGAIAASLIAAGYSGNEIKTILKDVDYKKFKQPTMLSKLGFIGKALSAIFKLGIYKTNYFENWLYELLNKKGIKTFSDLRNVQLKVTASDITREKLLILPDDLKSFGIESSEFNVAKAVKMSMSIPLFYKPAKLKTNNNKTYYIVDGGLLSNYPIFIFDQGIKTPSIPTFGFRFSGGEDIEASNKKPNFLEYTKSIVNTALEVNDNVNSRYLKGDSERTIFIPTTVTIDGAKKNITATDFDITKKEANALFANGYNAAKEFLKTWNFSGWAAKFRTNL